MQRNDRGREEEKEAPPPKKGGVMSSIRGWFSKKPKEEPRARSSNSKGVAAQKPQVRSSSSSNAPRQQLLEPEDHLPTFGRQTCVQNDSSLNNSISSNGRALRKNVNIAKVKRLHDTFA